MYTKLSAHLRALDILGVTTDSCAAIVYPIVESCLSEPILRAWQRDVEYKCTTGPEQQLKKLMEFMSREVRGEVNIQLACGGLSSVPENKNKKKNNTTFIPTTTGLMATNKQTQKKNNCLFCNLPHETSKCGKAGNLSYEEKSKIIQEKKACFKCLRPGHMKSACRAHYVKCHICGRDHETIMCQQSNQNKPSETQSDDANKQTSHSLFAGIRSEEILLQTVIVTVKGSKGEENVRALFDSGSQKSYVVKALVDRVGLEMVGEEDVIHGLFGGEQKGHHHKRLKIMLSSLDNTYTCDFTVSDVEKITGKINSVPNGKWISELKTKNITISDISYDCQPISILIGADVGGKLMTGEKIELSAGPVAINTKLGWTMMGKLSVDKLRGKTDVEMAHTGLNVETPFYTLNLHICDMDLPKLWDLDLLGIKEDPGKVDSTVKDSLVLKEFLNKIKINDQNRYEVELPWITNYTTLPNNRWIAETRLRSASKKLAQMQMFEKYDEVFKLWEKNGIIEEVKDDNTQRFYLPHRGVFKPESVTTPVRPVFDASCRFKGHPSLNDLLETGPNLLEEIPVLLTKFRLKAVGVLADITKAFLQICISDKDKDNLCFLWWTDVERKTLKIYRHSRVVFGVKSSPFILAATLKHLFKNCEDAYQNIASQLLSCFYVDNIVTSVESLEEAQKFQHVSNELLSSKNFILRDWEIGPVDDDKSVPVLGMTWNKKDDLLLCDIKTITNNTDVITKRHMLAITHSVFDPLGFVCPYTVIPKLLLQEAWSLKLGWDTQVPDDIGKKFTMWRSMLSEIKNIQAQRWITKLSQNKEDWSLHVFTDASQKAYGVCIFLRIEKQDVVEVHLIQAKARVAPLKTTTIPRLELIACLVGARLSKSVKKMIDCVDIKTYFWSDSSVAIYWIKTFGNWGSFVQNRVIEVRKLSAVEDWHHIPGEFNPADVPSRGATLSQLIQLRWWEGPKWLQKEESQWPKSNINPKLDDVLKEEKISAITTLNTGSQLEDVCKQKTYREMLFFVASRKNKISDENLTTKELLDVERDLFIDIQKQSFKGVDDKRLKAFNVFVDKLGLIRLKTRLDYGESSFSFKYPVILPGENLIVQAKIMEEHLATSHGSVTFLLAKMRKSVWILQGRKNIRKALKKCDCQRFSVESIKPPCPPLPKNRMEADVPFQITGVDLFGPLYVVGKQKVWVVLFTCAVYRAVHLELIESTSTDDFRAALRRFVARRGKPEVIYSDNGPNFHGCDNIFKKIKWTTLEQEPQFRPIMWIFNVPTASWWGGWFERLVGVVKQSIRKTIGHECLTFMELQTVLCDVGNTINQRPITYVSENPQDPAPLTPFMFLCGSTQPTIVEADKVDHTVLNKRLRHVQTMREDLRYRFKTEYLGVIKSSKQKEDTRKLSIGDVVLVGEDNRQRTMWPIGKVLQLIPSRDGEIRKVKVKVNGTELLRPVQRIYPFEVENPAEQGIVRSLLKTKRGGSVMNDG